MSDCLRPLAVHFRRGCTIAVAGWFRFASSASGVVKRRDFFAFLSCRRDLLPKTEIVNAADELLKRRPKSRANPVIPFPTATVTGATAFAVRQGGSRHAGRRIVDAVADAQETTLNAESYGVGQLVDRGILPAAVALETLSCGSARHSLAIHESALRITNASLTLRDIPAEQLWRLPGNRIAHRG